MSTITAVTEINCKNTTYRLIVIKKRKPNACATLEVIECLAVKKVLTIKLMQNYYIYLMGAAFIIIFSSL